MVTFFGADSSFVDVVTSFAVKDFAAGATHGRVDVVCVDGQPIHRLESVFAFRTHEFPSVVIDFVSLQTCFFFEMQMTDVALKTGQVVGSEMFPKIVYVHYFVAVRTAMLLVDVQMEIELVQHCETAFIAIRARKLVGTFSLANSHVCTRPFPRSSNIIETQSYVLKDFFGGFVFGGASIC